MTEKRTHAFCHEPTCGPDQMPHRCGKNQGHADGHRCTCDYEWTATADKPSVRSPKPGK